MCRGRAVCHLLACRAPLRRESGGRQAATAKPEEAEQEVVIGQMETLLHDVDSNDVHVEAMDCNDHSV